ncbi:hypothetical protein CVT24_012187 [Panaeolus cyanescens]|uniref:G domain-containing protein n=1 Tax=Panaeolus cyanescens TaxID=181874 RepID=A0A409W495_9AGAR|nr:hypothetical protein CVT24_012187 [Panaeolus cyanescens]
MPGLKAFMSSRGLMQQKEITVEPCVGDVPFCSYRIVMMGPTGSGKSSFIEALAGEGKNLGISGGSLDSVTHELKAYKVINLKNTPNDRDPVFLIDTPGFLDPERPEMEIVDNVGSWFQQRLFLYIHHVFYFVPISDIRATKTKKYVGEILKGLVGTDYESFTIVTTMWDQLCSPEAKARAELLFAQLQDEVFEEQLARGAQIVRFENRASAVDLLENKTVWYTCIPRLSFDSKDNRLIGPLLYKDVVEKAQGARQVMRSHLEEMIGCLKKPDPLLESVYNENWKKATRLLTKFVRQLLGFPYFPRRGVDGESPENVLNQHLIDQVSEARTYVQAIEDALKELEGQEECAERISTLRERLQVAQDALEPRAQSAEALADFGLPPTGIEPALVLDPNVFPDYNTWMPQLPQLPDGYPEQPPFVYPWGLRDPSEDDGDGPIRLFAVDADKAYRDAMIRDFGYWTYIKIRFRQEKQRLFNKLGGSGDEFVY